MKARRQPEDEPLTLWADQYVTDRERQRLGDDEGGRLAHRRRTAKTWARPPFEPGEDDVAATRPEVTASDRRTDEARQILAMRARLLDERHGLPFRDEADS